MKMELNGFLRMPLNSLEVLKEYQAFLFNSLHHHYLKEISAVPS